MSIAIQQLIRAADAQKRDAEELGLFYRSRWLRRSVGELRAVLVLEPIGANGTRGYTPTVQSVYMED